MVSINCFSSSTGFLIDKNENNNDNNNSEYINLEENISKVLDFCNTNNFRYLYDISIISIFKLIPSLDTKTKDNSDMIITLKLHMGDINYNSIYRSLCKNSLHDLNNISIIIVDPGDFKFFNNIDQNKDPELYIENLKGVDIDKKLLSLNIIYMNPEDFFLYINHI